MTTPRWRIPKEETPTKNFKRQTESREQQVVVKYFRLTYPQYKKNLSSFANQGKRTLRNGARMKAEGMTRGYPDFAIYVARGGFFGLFVEMKTPKGTVEKEQKEIHEALRAEGYAVVVKRGVDEAIKEIDNYMKQKKTKVVV